MRLFPLLVVLFFARTAEAQLPPPSLPPPVYYTHGQTFSVELVTSSPSVRFDVVRGKVPLATCVGACRVELPFGRYFIAVHETEETVGGRLPLEVTGPGVVRLRLESKAAHTTNKVMAIGGTTLAGVGLLALAGAILSGACAPGCQEPDTPEEQRREEQQDRERVTFALAGAGMMVVGGVLAAVGWVRFADSRRPDVGSTRRSRPARFRVGVAPLTKGAAISGVLAF